MQINGKSVAAAYGDGWDGKRHELIEACASGRTHSSSRRPHDA